MEQGCESTWAQVSSYSKPNVAAFQSLVKQFKRLSNSQHTDFICSPAFNNHNHSIGNRNAGMYHCN